MFGGFIALLFGPIDIQFLERMTNAKPPSGRLRTGKCQINDKIPMIHEKFSFGFCHLIFGIIAEGNGRVVQSG